MLKDKSLLEDFDLVEELDNRAAAAIVGGTLNCKDLPPGSVCLDLSEYPILCFGGPDRGWICRISSTPSIPENCPYCYEREDGRSVCYCL